MATIAAESKKRRPTVAAFLSLLLPGLGQLDAGRPRVALLWLAPAILVDLTFQWGLLPADRILQWPAGFWLLIGFFLLALAWQFCGVIHAFVSARRIGSTPLQRYQRWYIYIIPLILFIAPSFLWDASRFKPIASFSTPSGSMAPTLRIGDYFFASNNWFDAHAPALGDVVVHLGTKDSKAMFIKRIVGLPGDRVQYRDGRLYRNGEMVERVPLTAAEVGRLNISDENEDLSFYWERLPDGPRYLIAEQTDDAQLDDTDEFTVPAGNLFMLGDNRDNSADSRIWGFLPLGLLQAKPLYIFWASGRSRIGMALQPEGLPQ